MTASVETARVSLMRERTPGSHHRVTYVELFFDLVFVFAITQISHTLLGHFTPLGVLETSILFLAVWWVWIYTSWITNWLDPDRTPVRVLLFVMMLAGLVLSTSIPKAFEERGLTFGVAFAAMQVGRTFFMFRAVPVDQQALRTNFVRISSGFRSAACSGLRAGSRTVRTACCYGEQRWRSSMSLRLRASGRRASAARR
jgi:low temperature requirement protein LtrA